MQLSPHNKRQGSFSSDSKRNMSDTTKQSPTQGKEGIGHSDSHSNYSTADSLVGLEDAVSPDILSDEDPLSGHGNAREAGAQEMVTGGVKTPTTDWKKQKEAEEEPTFDIRKDAWPLILRLVRVNITLLTVFLGLLSIYWGALYKRENRVRNMPMLVVIEDESFVLTNGSRADAVLGPALQNLLEGLKQYGRFEKANLTALRLEAERTNTTVLGRTIHYVHHQKYWAALYVNATATQTVYDMLAKNTTAQPQYLILAVYESGRHYLALAQYVTKNLHTIGSNWLQFEAGKAYSNIIQYYLTEKERQALLKTIAQSIPIPLPNFNLVDERPSSSTAVLGPSELGLVYAQIFSFHQFNFSNDLHTSISTQLRFRHYLWYRVLFSQINHLVLSLVYGLMTLAFQVPVNPAYGHSGFLVLWMTMFLFISASGGLNEAGVTCILVWGSKALLAPWMIFNIVVNISPTFAPLVLSPGFYRYGYAMPMFNAYEALRVVFFNTWKGNLGRNYGILTAWIVVTNILLCYILKIVNDRRKKEIEARQLKREKTRRAKLLHRKKKEKETLAV